MKDKRLDNILNILVDGYQPTRIILFGSRANNRDLNYSDYDIAIDLDKTTLRQKRKVLEQIDEISGLHKIDLVYLNEVEEAFRKIILKTGKIIYER
ncbi:MAG: nucleotidyltransferase domain-containing protein [Ignavibacteria bacterium]|nr:nucleotidyltransferase domain-containing protein [Ignavibacteria bacterium]